VADRGWAWHLREKWKPDQVRQALDALPFLKLQEREGSQREFKISYDLIGEIDPTEAESLIHKALDEAKLAYSLILSHGIFVDVLPHRASKGKAVRYLAKKWNIPIERIATAGDSGNDRDMLLGKTAGIVVANHDEELATLRGASSDRIYFADAPHAAGILEGLAHYRLLPADASQGTFAAARS
jgi:sucrose-phosphate synthase